MVIARDFKAQKACGSNPFALTRKVCPRHLNPSLTMPGSEAAPAVEPKEMSTELMFILTSNGGVDRLAW